MRFLLRALAVWFVIICVETILGMLRTTILASYVGDFHARQIGTLTSSLMILAIACVFARWLRVVAIGQLLIVGLVWLVLTLLFELILGRFILGLSWERLASDYDITNGGLMPFGLLILTLAPLMAARISGIKLSSRT